MFILSKLEEKIAVPPAALDKPLADAVRDVIERDFVDHVIPHLGLVITLWDIQVHFPYTSFAVGRSCPPGKSHWSSIARRLREGQSTPARDRLTIRWSSEW